MKIKPLINIGALCLFIALQSCKEDTDDGMVVFVPPTGDEFTHARAEALAGMKQHFQFDAQQGGTFTSEKGVTVFFPANSLRINGSEVFGQVDLEYIEIVDLGNMLVTGIASQSVEVDVPQTLVSGGAFFVKVYREGQYFDIHVPYEITVPAGLANGVDEDMRLFTGGYYSESIGNGWERIVNGMSDLELGTDYYKASVDYCGWLNIAKVYTAPGPKTTVRAIVPPNCMMDNALVCISMQGVKRLLSTFERSNTLQDYQFIENKGIPVGETCNIIFFTGKGDDWSYIIHESTLVENHLETFDEKEIKSVSKNELLALVNQLP